MRHSLTLLSGLVGAILLAPTVSVAAHAADGRVSVTNERGEARADVRYRTELTVRGSGFQSVKGGFGGVYVLFGWVRDPAGGSWRPSEGGLTGQDYQYIPDAEDAADNQGYLTFIAFPGGSTTAEAAAVLSPSGGFSVDVTVPGPVFQSVDRSGGVSEVDCRRVTCGIITIGAHGVKNARNETFTPVPFGTVFDTAPATPAPAAGPEQQRPSQQAPSTSGAPVDGPTDGNRQGKAEAPAPRAGLSVERSTAVPGHALAFTGAGFNPGEQVLGVLDDGLAAVGPLVAGASGEIAAVLELPSDLSGGTHELVLTGAASGRTVSERFPVIGSSSTTESPTAESAGATTSDDRVGTLSVLFLAAAALVFVLALLRYAVVRRRVKT